MKILLLLALWTSSARGGETCACGGVLKQPHASDKDLSARWMSHTLDWGVLSTRSSRLDDSPPFGNVYSFIDGPCEESTGIPYFYGSAMDQSFKDLCMDDAASFTLSEASLPFTCGGVNLDGCKISAMGGDPENPLCARLTMTGKLVEIEEGSEEFKKVQSWLFQRHPAMASWPANHGWVIGKLVVDDIWFIDYFGGAVIMNVDDYFEAELDTTKYSSLAVAGTQESFKSIATTDHNAMAYGLACVALFGAGVLLGVKTKSRGYTTITSAVANDASTSCSDDVTTPTVNGDSARELGQLA